MDVKNEKAKFIWGIAEMYALGGIDDCDIDPIAGWGKEPDILRISFPDGEDCDIDLKDDLSIFETIAKVNAIMMDRFAEFEAEFDSQDEMEDWLNEEFDEIHIWEEVVPYIWHISATSYAGHPNDHHYWEGFDGYVRIKANGAA